MLSARLLPLLLGTTRRRSSRAGSLPRPRRRLLPLPLLPLALRAAALAALAPAALASSALGHAAGRAAALRPLRT